MINTKSPFSFAAVLAALALGLILFPPVQAQAGIDLCFIDIVKVTLPPDDTVFDFTCSGGVGGDCDGNSQFMLSDGAIVPTTIPVGEGQMATVVEDVPEGWLLDKITCEVGNVNSDNIIFDFDAVEDGVKITCVEELPAVCTFRNIGTCIVTIANEAVPDDGTIFDFTAFDSEVPEFSLTNGEEMDIQIAAGENVDVVELVPDNWVLETIECSVLEGVAITDIPNGKNFACINPNPDGNVDCAFINTPIRPIPTLSEWALLAMAAVLAIVGFLALRRRKAAA